MSIQNIQSKQDEALFQRLATVVEIELRSSMGVRYFEYDSDRLNFIKNGKNYQLKLSVKK